MISESTSTKAGDPHGCGAASVICLSVAATGFASDEVFAAETSNDPGGRLATFCVRDAFSFTVTV